ncbi:MAG: signal peptidase II [Lachnospiraceae bacterium]|nr:signal peptidase II [Lachnospiraceae bacterium]
MTDSKHKIKSYTIALLFCGVGVFIDQITKWLAMTYLEPIGYYTLIEGVFRLLYLENRGAAFGILQGHKPLLIVFTFIILVVVLWIYGRIPHTKRYIPLRIVTILLVSGAIGNLIDRIRLRFVVDMFFFELINFPVFNVADIYVVISCFFFLILVLFYYKGHELNFISCQKIKDQDIGAEEKSKEKNLGE